MKVSIIGQGYVGLPLAISCAQAGFKVTGIDLNEEKVSQLNKHKSIVEDVSHAELKAVSESGKYKATSNNAIDPTTEIICICVPTPLGSNHQPDLDILKAATKNVGKSLKAGMLVIIESTIQPGTTRDVVVPILEKESGLNRDQFLVAYSPERIDPMNKKFTIKNTPKLVAGLTSEAALKAKEFYSNFIDQVDVCDSLEVAETAKLLENSFRLVNISFINELAMFCQKIGIDVNDVIKAASTKPYGFMPFYPSVGVGGHCIPVDPLYLAVAARAVGAPSRFIELADEINLGIPTYFVGRASEILGGLKDKKVLVIGVSYKPNVADVRETPVEALINGLKKSGAVVGWHDDLVKSWNGESSVALGSGYDLAILATPHDYLDLSLLGSVPVLNTRGSK
ncbi:MAG: nucleotide sugar dehydrogenase, partial [Actinobacteria bacterium]|nr:nucleotide sugar dehydrogenase [Actinomycetota bacterium]